MIDHPAYGEDAWSLHERELHLDVLEQAALEHGRKPTADGLDLGQLRHRSTVAGWC